MKIVILAAIVAASLVAYGESREATSVTTIAAPAIWDSQDVINTVGYVALQHDSIEKNADSIRLETCRGGTINANGTCSGRKYAPRTTRLFTWSMRIKHHKYRADSSMNQLMILITPPALGHTSRVLSTRVETDADSTFCAHITRQDGHEFVGWWPVWRRTIGDSAEFRPRSGEYTMAQKCGKAFMEAGLTLPIDSIEVLWSGYWQTVNGVRSWRPLASVKQP